MVRFLLLFLITSFGFAAESSSPFLVILVNARHLDYTNNAALIKSLVKHPSDGSKNSDVGHAWIYLEGNLGGRRIFIEGGHSGETGRGQSKYFEGIINGIEYGHPNPSEEQKQRPIYEPNPVKYLWETLHDGFFQKGAGRHRPTYAAKIVLTEDQFFQILTFIQPENYCYQHYALCGSQCSSFVSQVAAIAGLKLESEVTIQIEKELKIGKGRLRLWEDPSYSTFTFSSPDMIEKSLRKAVQEGKAENVLKWYLKHYPKPLKQRFSELWESMALFPERWQRVRQFGG